VIWSAVHVNLFAIFFRSTSGITPQSLDTPPHSIIFVFSEFFPMRRFLLSFCLVSLVAVQAQEPAASPAPPSPSSQLLKIGDITVDKSAKSIRFPATVQLESGSLEYLLVTEEGKTHESLFATKVSPFKLHVAMLLLGVSPAQEIKELPPEQLNAASLKNAPELKGDKVDILISWKTDGKEQQVRAEDWIQNQLTNGPMTAGPWIYTSSAILKGTFLAQEEGSIVALVTDPVALINNPRPGHNDDTIWSVFKGKVPPANTPVVITFQRILSASPTPASSPK